MGRPGPVSDRQVVNISPHMRSIGHCSGSLRVGRCDDSPRPAADAADARPPTRAAQPGYLRPLLPEHAPEEPESFDDVMADIEAKVMPGVVHWQSPRWGHF